MTLKTTYMGLELASPLVPSSGPLSRELDNIKRMAECGAGAVVLWSLFEEQLRHDAAELEHYLHYGADRFAESLSYFPDLGELSLEPDKYLEYIAAARKAVDIPIIASLNGVSAGGWIDYAEDVAAAGADGIELNVYYIPTRPELDAERVEEVYLAVLKRVKAAVDIPVAMKLSPYFSATANMAARLDAAGVDALVLFNRFYQPDIDVDGLEVAPSLELSRPWESRLPLLWIALLYGNVRASLAATTGIHSGRDAARMILAGADVAMMTSVLIDKGIEHLTTMRDELAAVMDKHGYASIDEMRGVLSQQRCPEPAAFERANYVKTLNSFGQTATLE